MPLPDPRRQDNVLGVVRTGISIFAMKSPFSDDEVSHSRLAWPSINSHEPIIAQRVRADASSFSMDSTRRSTVIRAAAERLLTTPATSRFTTGTVADAV